MVSDCVQCGFKETEVKPGGAVSPFGKRVSLRVRGSEDLKRDLLKVQCEWGGFLYVCACSSPLASLHPGLPFAFLRLFVNHILRRICLLCSQSDTASVEIPEIELELQPGTLGGKYTTVEGLLFNIREKLLESNMFSIGDSATTAEGARFRQFLDQLDQVIFCCTQWFRMR